MHVRKADQHTHDYGRGATVGTETVLASTRDMEMRGLRRFLFRMSSHDVSRQVQKGSNGALVSEYPSLYPAASSCNITNWPLAMNKTSVTERNAPDPHPAGVAMAPARMLRHWGSL